jgi:hypothetical protein
MTRALIALLDARRGVLRHTGVPDEDADDVLQELALRLLRGGLARTSDLQSPEAWLTRVVRNAGHDFTRARKRRRTSLLDADDLARAIDREAAGAWNLEGPDDGAAAEQLEAAVAAYARCAARRGGRLRTGPEQVWAWYLSQVRGLDGAALRIALSERFPGASESQTNRLQQWASRGKGLVEELARDDDDGERAAMMTRAVVLTRGRGRAA